MKHIIVYLAAPWSHKADARLARAKFEAAGITVQADWIDLHPEGVSDHALLQHEAYRDLEQIRGADAFVMLALGPSSGGKDSEFMAAYLWNKPCIIVGDTGNVFFHLASVEMVMSVEEAISAVYSRCGTPVSAN